MDFPNNHISYMFVRACPSPGILIIGFLLFLGIGSANAGYKARPWSLRSQDSYSARLTSEGVTIAVEPLLQDALAAQVFEKNDMVTRGIMPLAIAIFNDNDFPIRVEAGSIELIEGEEHFHTLMPYDVVRRLYQKNSRGILPPQPGSKIPGAERLNREALTDLEHKFLNKKTVGPHDKGGGFLYLQLPVSRGLSGYLSRARVYIPEVYREDKGSKMIFFEIELKPAVVIAPEK